MIVYVNGMYMGQVEHETERYYIVNRNWFVGANRKSTNVIPKTWNISCRNLTTEQNEKEQEKVNEIYLKHHFSSNN